MKKENGKTPPENVGEVIPLDKKPLERLAAIFRKIKKEMAEVLKESSPTGKDKT